MRKLFLVLCVVTALAGGACWRAKSGDANANANATTEALPQYADAATALAEGTKFLDEGDINKAIDALDQAVKLDPNLAEAWFKLGIAHALAEKRDETLVSNEETLANKEGKAKSNSEKAFEKAVAAYKKLIDANPE